MKSVSNGCRYKTTLREIQKRRPLLTEWVQLLEHLGKIEADDEPLDFSVILESQGFAVDDTSFVLWLLRILPRDEAFEKDVRLLLCNIVERGLRFIPEDNERILHNFEIAKKYAKGEATDRQMSEANENSWQAWRDNNAVSPKLGLIQTATGYAMLSVARLTSVPRTLIVEAPDIAATVTYAFLGAGLSMREEQEEQKKIIKQWLEGEK